MFKGAGRRRRFSAEERRGADPGGPRGPGALWCPGAQGLALAMAEPHAGLGARLARGLARLGLRRERRGKRTPEEARARDR